MGLDMYAYKMRPEIITSPSDKVDVVFNPEAAERFHYWRKHPNLHGWMEKLYREKGGTFDTFNCAPMRLTLDDLNRLEDDIQAERLPPTSGFFFGQSYNSEEEREDDLAFVDEARAAIKEGYVVVYDAWW